MESPDSLARQLVENLPALVFTADRQGQLSYCNKQMRDFCGQVLEQPGKVDWFDFIHPEDAKDAAHAWQSAHGLSAPFEAELRLRRADAAYRWHLCRTEALPTAAAAGTADRKAESRQWIVTCMDVHGRRLAGEQRATVPEELWRSEEKFRNIFQSCPSILAITSLEDGRYLEVNAAFERVTGYTRAEIIGVSSLEAGLWPQPQRRKELIDKLQQEGCLRNEEIILVTRTGESREVLFSAELITVGEKVLVLSSCQDIVERILSEKALRQQKDELLTLLETLPIGVLIAQDAECQYITGNRTAYKLLRLEPGSNLSTQHPTPFTLSRHGQELAAEERPMIRAGRGEAVEEQELDLVFEDGQTTRVSISSRPLYTPSGDVRGAVASIQDVSELKRAQDTLKHTADQLQTVLDHVPAYIYQLDTQNCYVFVNRAYAKLMEYKAEDLIGLHISQVFAPPVAESFIENNRTLLQGNETQAFEEQAPFSGGIRFYSSVKAPVFNGEGKPVGILGISTDITERIRIENVLRDADQRKDEFLAVLGHELRNPLAPLKTGLELLEHQDKPELRHKVRLMMQRQVYHLTRLVDDLLDMSRISRGKIELQASHIDLNLVAEAALEQVKPLLSSRQHQVLVDYAGKPLPVFGDFERLTQVLVNLLTNAAKYMDPGGTITLSTLGEAGQARARVGDTGFGIPEERLEHIFEMFTQIPEHQARTGGSGLGIGLSLSRQLIELHNGSITVNSNNAGQGTEFTVHLPLAGSLDQALPLPVSAPEQAYRVLLVDDNVDAAVTLGEGLRLRGHDVKVVHDGVAALASLQDFRPAFILLDIGLPGMDGYEVARRVRELPRGREIALIAITGWGQEEDKARARQAGFDEHLTKPVDTSLLSALMTTNACPSSTHS